MSGGWLCWQDEHVLIVAEEGQLCSKLPERVLADQVDEIGFAVGRSWQIVLPSEDGPRFFLSNDGQAWQSVVAPIPTAMQEISVGLHPNAGRVSIIEDETLHFYVVGETWHTLPLPQGTIWVGAGADNTWWAVGSQPSQRVRGADREAALWHQHMSGDGWTNIAIRASWWDAYRTIRDGGFEEIRAIDAYGSPLVLASECAWFLDDPSWFLFTGLPSGKFAIQRLPRTVLARIERTDQGMPIVVTTDGELWDWDGRRWQPRGSAATLRNAVSSDGRNRRYHIHLALAGNEIYGVVTWLDTRTSSHRIAVRSTDRGRSWSLLRLDETLGIQPIAAWAK